MSKHRAEATQCDAICAGKLAEKFGFIIGSRCTAKPGHPVPRNGVGHYYPKNLKARPEPSIDPLREGTP